MSAIRVKNHEDYYEINIECKKTILNKIIDNEEVEL